MTRAADRLYVCGWANGRQLPRDCWYELVRRGLEPIAEAVEMTVRAAGSTGWRGPGFRLVTPQRSPVPRAEPDGPTANPPPLPEWARQPAPREPAPTRPLMPSRPSEPAPPMLSPLAATGEELRRGILVHRLLELLPALEPRARADAARRFLARPVHGLHLDEQARLAAEVIAVLESPEAAGLFGPQSRAEVPVVGTVGGEVVSGRIDRIVVEGSAVRIVDYKTNRPIPAGPHAIPGPYLRQLALYRALLAKIYRNLTITAGILWTAGPRLMWITEGQLSGAILDHAPPEN
jgi:ATP-dependent helicase/nuclease subunit A